MSPIGPLPVDPEREGFDLALSLDGRPVAWLRPDDVARLESLVRRLEAFEREGWDLPDALRAISEETESTDGETAREVMAHLPAVIVEVLQALPRMMGALWLLVGGRARGVDALALTLGGALRPDERETLGKALLGSTRCTAAAPCQEREEHTEEAMGEGAVEIRGDTDGKLLGLFEVRNGQPMYIASILRCPWCGREAEG